MSKYGRVISLGILAIVTTAIVLLMTAPPAYAIPAFSRQYGTSCSTCHLDFPKLNDFGKAFKDAGFKFPTDDESMLKIPPVLLGAPANKELWPHTIWPGSIPGLPPIGLRMNNFFQLTGRNRNNFQFVPGAAGLGSPPANPAAIGSPAVSLYPPKTDFETGFFSIFTAGNFGSDIAFWVDDDISVSGANGNGTLGDGYLRFVNLSRFVHLPKDSLSLRFGTFELDLPFSQARTWNISPWDIYTQANIGTPAQPLVSNGFTFSSATGPAGQAKGAEISGGHHYGGYWYSLAVFDQNTTGIFPVNIFVPSATGGNGGGLPLGFTSDSNYKDLYGHFEYRFNLEKDKASRNAIQAAGATGPRDHTYLSLGGFYMNGRSVQRLVGTLAGSPAPCASSSTLASCTLLTAREPFYRTGADFSFNYRTFNLFGLWMYGRDHNLLPVSNGVVVAPPDFTVTGFAHGQAATFDGGFLQADYLVYPWMMLIMRYDAVNSREDFINGQNLIGSNFFAPAHTTRNRYTPGVQFLIHANIKASFEYQIRPEQQIINGVDPLTGASLPPIRPFRVNTAVAGLEFVY